MKWIGLSRCLAWEVDVKAIKLGFPLVALFYLTACGGGGSPASNNTPPPTKYTIGGTISGLSGSGLMLQNNGGENLAISAGASSFTFATAVASGSSYNVTVLTQPSSPAQTCSVSGGSGTANANITSIQVSCTTNTVTYTVGGSVSGSTGTLVLQLNGGNNLTITGNGNFKFGTTLNSGASYAVTVATQPAGQICTVSNGMGTITGNVTNVSVACATGQYSIGGTVTGLNGTLVLWTNGVSVTITSDGSFTFPGTFPGGTQYVINLNSQPANQACVITNGTGKLTSDVTNITVTCSNATGYTVGGTVSGLKGTLILEMDYANPITLTNNGSFTFPNTLINGEQYDISVGAQPTGQTCTIANGSGVIFADNPNNVTVTCTAEEFSLGGTVTGLNGRLILQNGSNMQSVTTNGPFTFSTSVLQGSTYAVIVGVQPIGQACTVTSGSGTVAGNITNVGVTCTTTSSTQYQIGGTVSGLNGTLVLQNNGEDDLTVNTPGSFHFDTAVASGGSYAVTVKSQPTGQGCSVSYGTGIVSADVTNISVTCVNTTASQGYGAKRIMVAHLKFADTLGDPFPTSDTAERLDKLSKFFGDISYNASSITYTIQPWAALPDTRATYQSQNSQGSTMVSAAISYAESNFDLSATDILVLALTPLDLGEPGCYEQRMSVQVNGSTKQMPVLVLSGYNAECAQDADSMSHETGHGYGLATDPAGFLHTSDFDCYTWPNGMPITFTDPTYNVTDCGIGNGAPDAVFYPYANYDFMGGYRGQPNVFWKLQAGWLNASQITQTTDQGTTVLDALEVASSGPKAVQVSLGNDQAGNPVSYWIEYRSQKPESIENPALSLAGSADVVKIWIDLPAVPGASVQRGTSIINQSEVFTFNEYQSGSGTPTLLAGDSFVDPYRGVTITRNANPTGGTVPQASVAVQVSKLVVSPNIGSTLTGSGTQDFVVTNNSTTPISQSGVSITGRDALSFRIVTDGCSGTTLQPGAQCDITVTQSRSGGDTATKFGILQWTTGDPLRPTPTVGLVGNP